MAPGSGKKKKEKGKREASPSKDQVLAALQGLALGAPEAVALRTAATAPVHQMLELVAQGLAAAQGPERR